MVGQHGPLRTLQRHSCFCGSCLPCKEHQRVSLHRVEYLQDSQLTKPVLVLKDLWGTALPDNVLAILVTLDRAEQSRMHLVSQGGRLCSRQEFVPSLGP